MSPRYSMANAPDLHLADAIIFGHHSLLTGIFEDFNNLLFSKLGCRSVFSTNLLFVSMLRCAMTIRGILQPLTTLCRHVSHIVAMRTSEQMKRANARWVITEMTNMLPFGYGATQKLPDRSMCADLLSIDINNAITSLGPRTSPLQTRRKVSQVGFRNQCGLGENFLPRCRQWVANKYLHTMNIQGCPPRVKGALA